MMNKTLIYKNYEIHKFATIVFGENNLERDPSSKDKESTNAAIYETNIYPLLYFRCTHTIDLETVMLNIFWTKTIVILWCL